jgi:protocatechuate 3,4-dioxygenase beta subunit
MTSETLPVTELVVLATDQADDLAPAVRRLARHLATTTSCRVRVVLADHASTDGTGVVVDALAAELGVDAVHLTEPLDRKELRAAFADRRADVVAFVTLTTTTDLDAVLAPLGQIRRRDEARLPWHRRPIGRRGALAGLGGLGLGALLAACGSGNSGSSSATTAAPATTAAAGTTAPAGTTAAPGTAAPAGTTATTTPATTTPATTTPATTGAPTATTIGPVALAPELTEGPYYLDLDLMRADIVEDRRGLPLALTMVVVDASGVPIRDATVDLWHCDAAGTYSGVSGNKGTFLRGSQISGADGRVTFRTIYPGWYPGRTVHLHVKAHVGGKEVHTGQLFFDDAFTDTVYAADAAYQRSGRRTLNSADGIYRQGSAAGTLEVTKVGNGYTATTVMAVRRS